MTRHEKSWWLVCLFWVMLIVLLAATGCDDTTPPDIKYLEPPAVVRMGASPNMPRLDAWLLTDNGFPGYAAFGWTITHSYSTGEKYDRPGIHTQFSVDSDCLLAWGGSVLPTFAMAPGDDMDRASAGSITVIADESGVATVFFGASGWPDDAYISNGYAISWHTLGMEACTDATSEVLFRQETGWKFGMPRGALGLSWQGIVYDGDLPIGGASMSLLSMGEGADPNEPNYVPFEINPTEPLPKVLVALIQPVLTECANSVDYPPYSDPNTNGEGILVRSRWMKVEVVDGEWALSPAPFITLLPYDSNDVTSIAETAWPYTISYHTPAQSDVLGTVEAKLSIVDPNGVEAEAIEMIVHEVGPCQHCNSWLWRSDYLLLLAGTTQEPLLTWAGDVLVCRLPLGHKIKIDLIVTASTLFVLAANWLAQGSVLDLDGDGIVGFRDYGILLGMR